MSKTERGVYYIMCAVLFLAVLFLYCVTPAEAQDYTVTKTITGYVIKPTIPRKAHIPLGDPRREMYYPTRKPSAYAAPSTPRRVQRRRLKYPVLVCRPIGPVLAWIR